MPKTFSQGTRIKIYSFLLGVILFYWSVFKHFLDL